ncbi:LysM peptidoglycan-binding domain-containing protein [Pedobacter rhizosphaerae]|uniref:LysM repeat-containing protein n=1 Tax=Pedobacter rhizosphaerae TaxID=390241 RepID=A0A1H9KUY7_9SPHI|nr:LysM peptidoglycan-binding domain-containing protein [Pedobacter rhizosphaerae]SER03004.1 LysM repeat-containing protein [Pedobacter rhizosphaerae]
MHKIYLSAVLLLAINAANAKATAVRDSIGVENNKGKKLIIHQTVAKDTYYSIGRRYNVSPKDIMAFNDNKYLQVGVVIKVPTNIPFSGPTSTPSPSSKSNVIEHTVIAKDNLNKIAEKYGTTVNDIKSLNNLSGNNLSIGQVLKVQLKGQEQATPEPVKESPKRKEEPANTSSNSVDPTTIEHTVQPKEFLGKIAEKYGTTVEEIKKANGLSGNNLRIGQKLKIPATQNVTQDKVINAGEPKEEQQNNPKDNPGTHTVLRNETIFTIAKQYGVTAYQIRKLNNLEDNTLKIGQVIKVPSDIVVDVPKQEEKREEKKKEEKVKDTSVEKEESFVHTVATGENIFSIAKKYNLTAYQIRTANKLEDNTITVGQKLVIPKPPQPRSVNDASKEDQQSEPDSTMVKDPKLRRDPSVYGLSQIEEKGTAVWIADQDLDASKMLVLHRTAPIGRVVKITNPMTNRSTFAKVVGKFTENESTKDVIIVMTKAVADSLGALDKRFFCNITYSAQ